jgi:hypothetical protein
MADRNRESNPFTKTAHDLREMASSQSNPPPKDGAQPIGASGTGSIAAQQVAIAEAIGQSLETVGEVVVELRASVDEDERVRLEVREQNAQVQKLRRTVRVAVYSCAVLVLVTAAASVASSVGQLHIARDSAERVRGALDKINTIDANSARALEVMLKQADAHAKSVEAEAALTPEAEHDALKAAIEAQESVAEAAIDVAAQRRLAPPPEARAALKKARAKKAKLDSPGPLQSFAQEEAAPEPAVTQSKQAAPIKKAAPLKQLAPRK